MCMDAFLPTAAYIKTIATQPAKQKNIAMDVLRLDEIHPLISGNKWFKLKQYLQQAAAANKKVIITFGGPFSNHIHATAAACKAFGFTAVGIIRGEEPKQLSPTLTDALALGMELYFVPREVYKLKEIPQTVLKKFPQALVINEGGYGKEGMLGAQEILSTWNQPSYTHIMAAVGTGTTLAGLITSALPHQKVIGISVLKNNASLQNEVVQLTGRAYTNYRILHNYHMGGYAKSSTALFTFMNKWYQQTAIPTDFVYTAKLFYGMNQLIKEDYFPENSKLLIIHSGGLQGNRSLPKDTLIF